MSSKKRFQTILEQQEGSTVTAIMLPFDAEEAFGKRGRVPVRGTINGTEFRSSVFRMGNKPYFMVVNRLIRERGGLTAGEKVSVVMERDDEPRTIEPPDDFAQAVHAEKDAQAVWDKLSFTHRREYVQAIEEAKRPETRARRIVKTIEQLKAKGKN